jgi:hypothetical protein
VLGRALLLAGNPKSGSATLSAVLKRATDPMTRNNAAYQLAQAGVELPLAETASRQAIDQFTDQTSHFTLEDSPETLRASRLSLASNWDTLGYVLFREGKLDEARSFVSAAWTSKPSDEVGEHLGDILAAQGDKPAALAIYELAFATIPARDTTNAHGFPKDLQTRADALRKAGVASTAADPGEALLSLRSVPLDVPNAATGEVEYRLLLKSGKAIKAEPTAADAAMYMTTPKQVAEAMHENFTWGAMAYKLAGTMTRQSRRSRSSLSSLSPFGRKPTVRFGTWSTWPSGVSTGKGSASGPLATLTPDTTIWTCPMMSLFEEITGKA